MASVGQIVQPTPTREVLSRAQARAALIPDCMVEAQRLANTVIAGWHGRRKRGIGENFWQFRPYVDGESLSRIDWRRSARDAVPRADRSPARCPLAAPREVNANATLSRSHTDTRQIGERPRSPMRISQDRQGRESQSTGPVARHGV